MYADFTVSLAAGGAEEGETSENSSLPRTVELAQNYPNPFNPSTTISFYTSQSGVASIRVFDLSGRKVRTLIHESVNAGNSEVGWDGLNDAGSEVASGIYLYRLEINEQEQTRKMVLVR